jgi:hypothetical protein
MSSFIPDGFGVDTTFTLVLQHEYDGSVVEWGILDKVLQYTIIMVCILFRRNVKLSYGTILVLYAVLTTLSETAKAQFFQDATSQALIVYGQQDNIPAAQTRLSAAVWTFLPHVPVLLGYFAIKNIRTTASLAASGIGAAASGLGSAVRGLGSVLGFTRGGRGVVMMPPDSEAVYTYNPPLEKTNLSPIQKLIDFFKENADFIDLLDKTVEGFINNNNFPSEGDDTYTYTPDQQIQLVNLQNIIDTLSGASFEDIMKFLNSVGSKTGGRKYVRKSKKSKKSRKSRKSKKSRKSIRRRR